MISSITWAQITAILFAGGLMLLIVGTAIDHTAWQAVGFVSFVTALIILFYSFREADN